MRRQLHIALAFIVAFCGIVPAFFLAAPKAQAYCSLISHENAGAPHVVVGECQTGPECLDWMDVMVEGLSPNYNWEVVCKVVAAPSVPANPLGEPSSLIPAPAPQVAVLEAACYGESCDGLNPEGTRCEVDAYTIYSQEVVITSEWSSSKGAGPWGIAEMRYSPTCHSNWVRYTPYTNIDDVLRFIFSAGVKASNDDNGPGGGKGLGTYHGVPYIWRLGVENSLRGPIGSSDPMNWQVTKWTSMVSADGATCWSVEIHWKEDHHAGAGVSDHIGTFDTDCVT